MAKEGALVRKNSFRIIVGCSALLLVLTGCGGGGKSPKKSTGSGTATASAGDVKPLMSEPMTHKMQPAHVDLLALDRTQDKYVTARFRIVNDGTGPLNISSSLGEEWSPSIGIPIGIDAGGVALVDALHNQVYYPSRGGDGHCLCSNLSGKTLPAGGTLDVYAVFPAPPADVTRITVALPLTVPFQDVQLGSGTVPIPDPSLDPARTQVGAPRIFSLDVSSDGDTESTDEDAKNRAVKLSADVLFAINKADLTPVATSVLQGLAKQIDSSTGTTVKVDGYTDSTGNDAINQPLSENRAKAVSTALQRMVTRQGVTFQPTGHGSADPVADNNSVQGRRKNRRVTVTFALPVPKSSAPAAASGVPFQWSKAGAQVIATGHFTNDNAKDLKIEVNGLHRDASGLTTLVWTVRNTGTGHVDTSTNFELSYRLQGVTAPHRGYTDGGIMAVDPTAKVRYHSVQAQIGHCICTGLTGDAKTDLGPNESTTYYDVYKLPLDVQTIDLQFPWSDQEIATVGGVPVK
jgi:outer membrane protein OmpA-like peptidoglycan-associated protein